MTAVKIIEKTCKSCLNKSNITDFTLNPYVGCEHACRYCYADYMRRWSDIEDKWGEFVIVKTNAPEILKKELAKMKGTNLGSVWIGSVCDCYMPLEQKLELTRKILETFNNSGKKADMQIVTKSTLVRRDLKLLKELDAEIGVSVGIGNDNTSSIIEPKANLPSERFSLFVDLNKEGIKNFAFISPVIPGLSNLEEIFSQLDKVGCKEAWIEILNIKKSVIDKLEPIIRKKLPEYYSKFIYGIENYNMFCKNIEKEAKELSEKYGIKLGNVIVHQRDFKK